MIELDSFIKTSNQSLVKYAFIKEASNRLLKTFFGNIQLECGGVYVSEKSLSIFELAIVLDKTVIELISYILSGRSSGNSYHNLECSFTHDIPIDKVDILRKYIETPNFIFGTHIYSKIDDRDFEYVRHWLLIPESKTELDESTIDSVDGKSLLYTGSQDFRDFVELVKRPIPVKVNLSYQKY
jgi:ankyrin repeat protein